MKSRNESGFVLVTGLIFLVLITLLAVSSMGTATLQERASSNMRDRNETLIASDAALRHAEQFIALQNSIPLPGDTEAIWDAGGPLSDVTAVKEYLEAETWSPARKPATKLSRVYGDDMPAAVTPLPGRDPNVADDLPPPRYFIEDFGFSPDSLSIRQAGRLVGDKVYRVTGHAEGRAPSTAVTVQSTYRKRFN